MTLGNIDSFDPFDNQDVKYLEELQQIIINSIKKTELDLSNYVVLTEAATGNWITTPLIAAFSNSPKVICYTKNSSYGNIENIIQNFNNISKFLGLEDRIIIFTEKYSPLVTEADIITNSGLLRPIDKKLIHLMKKTAVISLMWEPWEFRDGDIDLHECFKNEIPILGVNENNALMNIMKYDGDAIVKIISDNSISIANKNIIIVGENISAIYMYFTLKSHHANISFVTTFLTNDCIKKQIPIIGKTLNDPAVVSYLKKCDIIIINSIPFKNEIIGNDGIASETLQQYCPNVSIFVYFGIVDYENINRVGLQCYPSIGKSHGYMNWTVDILGPKPTIELSTLGLKVGEILANNRVSSKLETEKTSLKNSLCLDFSFEQKLKYS